MIDIKPDVILCPVHREGTYQLFEDVRFRVDDLLVVVPAGFETDGASIPRFAWITTGTPFDPRHIRAAVLHDYLYRNNITTRTEADRVFKRILRFDGVGAYQAWKMYLALRVFGWMAWWGYKRKEGVQVWGRRTLSSERPVRAGERAAVMAGVCPYCDGPLTKVSNALGENPRLMCESCAFTVEAKS